MVDGKPASTFGPYQILGPLGRGGGGEVYRAWDPRLHREVALKILRQRSETDPERLRRFVAEARAASGLNHPNILTVFDAAVEGETPYIVSELIDGESLATELRRGPFAIRRLLDLAAQIADGLADAHAAGIVHRDLKPENIMVTRAGRAKILDFGLARPAGFQPAGGIAAAPDSQTMTEPGLLEGTVPYMSPEQARGAATIDFRSDQFSLGLVLYEMATGRPAFRRDTPAGTLEAIVADEPPPLSEANSQLPLMFCWIVERCLAKHPGDRYGVTVDLHRDLRTLRDRLPEAVARETRVGRSLQPRQSSAWQILTAVGALVLVATLASVWALSADRPPDLSALRFMPFATETGYEGFPAWSPDGQTVAYTAEQDGVLQIFTRRRGSASAAPITESGHDCKFPFWSPDGRRVYYISQARDREGLWSVPAGSGVPQLVLPDATRAAISPDGTTLAFLRDETRADVVGTASLWLTNGDGTAPPRRYDRAPFGDLRFTEAEIWFSPDGRTLAISGVPGTIALEPERRGWQFWLLPLPNGPPTRRLQWWPNPAPRIAGFTWLPGSRFVVLGMISTTMPGSHLWIADVDRDRAWPLAPGATGAAHPSASSSGNGNEIVFTSDEPHYDIVQIPLDGGPVRNLVSTSLNEMDPVWSMGAKAYAYITDRTGVDEVWLRTGEGPLGERALVTQADFKDDRTIMLSSPSFSPDGARLAYQRNASRPVWPLRVWYSPVVGGTPVPLLPETHEGYQGAPTWSPDGQWIAFAEWDTKRWKLVKVRVGGGEDTAESLVTVRTDGVANATPHWSPARDWITWETDQGFFVVSASNGAEVKQLGTDPWLVHTWSRDGLRIIGIRQTDDLHLRLVSVDASSSGRERELADLGLAPPVNNPVRGLSLGPDGNTLITSIARMRGDLWLLEGLRPPRRVLDRLWRRSP
jgi:serine/threonine protein kinase/Tol biopolymer transport system component